ncbi:ABC transporter OS=Streptomyces glaucescens OX=1907 GN=SGLAU_27810 PE=4 SV=1 [Streptomyces glaucescens]
MRLTSDRHFEASLNLSTWAIARRLPSTLAQAARLGWHTDRRAVLALLACQIGAAVLTATALTATTRVLSAVFTADDIAAGLRDNLTAVVVVALAASGRYLLDAAARASAARLAPKAVREADLKVITAATAVELVAYEDPDFADAHAAASDGAEKTGDLIRDAQLLTSATAQMTAAATVITVLHPVMLPMLVASVIPCAWAAVRGARIKHTAHHQNLADSRLRNVFRAYTTERNTARPSASSSASTASSPAAWRLNS